MLEQEEKEENWKFEGITQDFKKPEEKEEIY